MEGTEGYGVTLGQFREYIKDLPDETVMVALGDPRHREVFYMFTTEYRLFSQGKDHYEKKPVLVLQS